jgi:ABC-type dipeptide/oligopeptide/nickel transport system permease subunit
MMVAVFWFAFGVIVGMAVGVVLAYLRSPKER